MHADETSGPGIRIPPPAFYLTALVIGIALNYLWPLSFFAGSSNYVVGALFVIVSLAMMPPILMRFRRAGTTFDVRKAASRLITDGPYRFSRNPAYLALTLVYLGIGILLDNGWVLVLVLPVFVLMHRGIVPSEERHLEAKFGEQYLRYKAAVRRWL